MSQMTNSPAFAPRSPSGTVRTHVLHNRVQSVTLCTPASRMCVIVTPIEERGADHEVCPVVAIQACVTRTYRALALDGRGPSEIGTERQLLRAGWRFDAQELLVEPMFFFDGSLGLLGAIRSVYSDDAIFTLVSTPWPVEQDPDRLTPHFNAALRQARESQLRRGVRR